MGYGVKLKVWGDYACFTRPEFKVERVSYEAITPSAARGILEAIHWLPAIRWKIDKVHVLEPIQFINVRKNEVGVKAQLRKARRAIKSRDLAGVQIVVEEERQQRSIMALKNVAYVIEAHLEMTSQAGPTDNPQKHREIFKRRASKGQCFHRPAMGLREFDAEFELVEEVDLGALKVLHKHHPKGVKCLGRMLYDIDFTDDRTPRFFDAKMVDGVVDVAVVLIFCQSEAPSVCTVLR